MLMSYLNIVCPELNYGLWGYAPRVTFTLTEALQKGFCACEIRNYTTWTSAWVEEKYSENKIDLFPQMKMLGRTAIAWDAEKSLL